MDRVRGVYSVDVPNGNSTFTLESNPDTSPCVRSLHAEARPAIESRMDFEPSDVSVLPVEGCNTFLLRLLPDPSR